MTRDDYEYAKSIYEKMFWMQVFKPDEMKKAYRCLFGAEPANVQQARGRVAAYFRYNVAPVFEDETISVASQNWTHEENDTVIIDGDIVPNQTPSLFDIPVKPKRKRITKKK